MSPAPLDHLPARLLAWYDRHRRDLPWRAKPGRTADPYAVWLSEIMLQQTTVATIRGRFGNFVARWPDVASLAAAPLDDILHEWAGLGYYARARNLHACARAVVEIHGGRFPTNEADLAALPGIGAYTAAAVAAIAFDRKATVVDGNVERVIARLHAVETPMPAAKRELRDFATALTPASRPGDYAQAMMDLGATVCTPRNPRCGLCPLNESCQALALGTPEAFPRRLPKAARPVRHGVVYWITREDGAVLLRQRQAKGLLGGMMEFPSTEWGSSPWPDPAAAAKLAPLPCREWRVLIPRVGHTFTHFHLELAILAGEVEHAPEECLFVPPARLGEHALPTLMRKVADAVLG
jgi:A/G-specific adenine glycosylase